MTYYIEPIKWAIVIFPLLAFLITIPYMIIQYHKYGSIHKLRTFIVYSFIFYLLCVYFLVILPLPTIESVRNMSGDTMQLVPFNFVGDILIHTSLKLNDVSTYLIALIEPGLYNILFNILMFIPLGIYLRYYFKNGLFKTIFICFIFSLFLELTQLSGLYFIYPRPYRLFDVDDLIINTFGGLLGYGIGYLFVKILPSRVNIDKESFIRGEQVSFGRRLMAFMLDLFFISVVFIFLLFIFRLDTLLLILFGIFCLIYFIVVPVFKEGATLGKIIVRIKVVNENNKSIKFWQILVREFVLYLIILPMPIYALISLFGVFKYNLYIIFVTIGLGLLSIYLYLYQFIMLAFYKDKILLHDKVSKTKVVSNINKMLEEDYKE